MSCQDYRTAYGKPIQILKRFEDNDQLLVRMVGTDETFRISPDNIEDYNTTIYQEFLQQVITSGGEANANKTCWNAYKELDDHHIEPSNLQDDLREIIKELEAIPYDEDVPVFTGYTCIAPAN